MSLIINIYIYAVTSYILLTLIDIIFILKEKKETEPYN